MRGLRCFSFFLCTVLSLGLFLTLFFLSFASDHGQPNLRTRRAVQALFICPLSRLFIPPSQCQWYSCRNRLLTNPSPSLFFFLICFFLFVGVLGTDILSFMNQTVLLLQDGTPASRLFFVGFLSLE